VFLPHYSLIVRLPPSLNVVTFNGLLPFFGSLDCPVLMPPARTQCIIDFTGTACIGVSSTDVNLPLCLIDWRRFCLVARPTARRCEFYAFFSLLSFRFLGSYSLLNGVGFRCILGFFGRERRQPLVPLLTTTPPPVVPLAKQHPPYAFSRFPLRPLLELEF